MKFGKLKSVAHNIADSLASGLGFPIGVFGTDIFGEVERSSEGFIEANFLTGETTDGASESLARAVKLYAEALPQFCERQGISQDDFQTLTVRFQSFPLHRRYTVTIQDSKGRLSSEEYEGLDGRRA